MRLRCFSGALLIVTGSVAFACGSEGGSSGAGASGGAAGDSGRNTGGTSSGGSDATGGKGNKGGTGGKQGEGGMGGMGGEGPVEPTPTYDVLGAWEQTCDHLEMGDERDACIATPWKIQLGRAVLGGPPTFASRGGACHSPSVGTFSYTDETLELFNCGSGDPQNAPDAEGLRFEVEFADEGEIMVLVGEDAEYVLRRAAVPSPSVSSKRLLHVAQWSCASSGSWMRFQTVDHDRLDGWSSTLTVQNGVLFMDEFFSRAEGTSSGNWAFYDKNSRGAQAAEFPLEPGTKASFYKVTHAADLTPTYAVGFEVDDCSDAGSDLRAFEHDFLRDATFRRFWNTTAQALDATSVIAVDGLDGSVDELIVTVRTSGTPSDTEWTFSLTSPGGTTVTLVSGVVGNGSLGNFEYTNFADYAATSIADPELGSLEDILVPLHPLSTFQGEPKNGSWTLTVSSGGGGGSLIYFGLSIR